MIVLMKKIVTVLRYHKIWSILRWKQKQVHIDKILIVLLRVACISLFFFFAFCFPCFSTFYLIISFKMLEKPYCLQLFLAEEVTTLWVMTSLRLRKHDQGVIHWFLRFRVYFWIFSAVKRKNKYINVPIFSEWSYFTYVS